MIDDVVLLRAYAENKSEAAFAELVQRRVGLVYAVALRHVGGDRHLAEDVAQKVFLALARIAPTLVRKPTLGGWLYSTAHHIAVDTVRTERRRRAREPHGPLMADASENSSVSADWIHLSPVLDEAMNRLAARDRDAVALRFFEGRSFAETGRALKVSEEAARKRVDRALDKMSAVFSRHGITSTAAAISLALAEQATFAAPKGLAATVTGTALAGATVATGWTLYGFLITAKASVALGAAALIAVALALHQGNQARTSGALLDSVLRERKALTTEVATTRERLALAEQHARAAEDDNGKLLIAIEAVRRSQTLAVHPRAAQPVPENTATPTKGSEIQLRLIQLTRQPGDTDASLANQANLILNRFRAGESFAALAKEFSRDKRREKGGDWGWLKPADLRGPYRSSAFSLNKGEVASPLILPEGCIIMYAEDTK